MLAGEFRCCFYFIEARNKNSGHDDPFFIRMQSACWSVISGGSVDLLKGPWEKKPSRYQGVKSYLLEVQAGLAGLPCSRRNAYPRNANVRYEELVDLLVKENFLKPGFPDCPVE